MAAPTGFRVSVKALAGLTAGSSAFLFGSGSSALEDAAGEFLVSNTSLDGADKCVYQEFYLDGTSDTEVETDTVNDQCHIDVSGFSTGTHYLNVWFRDSTSGDESEKVPFTYVKS